MSRGPWKQKGHTRKWKDPRTAQRRASRKWYRKNKRALSPKRAERRFRVAAIAARLAPPRQQLTQQIWSGHDVRPGRFLDRPSLLWLDAHGNLHREEELSAEELIRRWKEQHK